MLFKAYLSVCKELISTDLLIFKNELMNKCIDLIIWVVLNLGVVAYIMPHFGLTSSFGIFQFGGILAAAALFELYGNVASLVSDFNGNRIIDYQLTLPIPSSYAILSKVCYYAISYMIITCMMLPVGILFLWQQIDFLHISYIKLMLAIMVQSIFYASFIMLPASMITSTGQMRTVWARFIFPLWILGGFQFSWFALHKIIPHLSYILLLNPLIYITEALRTALIGQEGFINFWLCLGVLLCFSILLLQLSLRKLKNRLDYV